MTADLASAKQHLSAALRHMIRATDQCQPGDPLVGILAKISDAYLAFTQSSEPH